MAAVPWDKLEDLKVELTPELKSVLDKSAAVAAKMLPKDIGISFDQTNPAAVAWVKEHVAELIDLNIIPESQAAIRAIILRSFEEGIAPMDAARLIREHIGILPRHAEAVEKYRQELLTKFREQKLITAEQDAMRLAERYASKLINYRAKNISRTETLNASAAGQDALWQQAISEDLMDPAEWERVWIGGETERSCKPCQNLSNTTAPMNGPFAGGIMRPTRHPSCRCTLGAQRIK